MDKNVGKINKIIKEKGLGPPVPKRGRKTTGLPIATRFGKEQDPSGIYRTDARKASEDISSGVEISDISSAVDHGRLRRLAREFRSGDTGKWDEEDKLFGPFAAVILSDHDQLADIAQKINKGLRVDRVPNKKTGGRYKFKQYLMDAVESVPRRRRAAKAEEMNEELSKNPRAFYEKYTGTVSEAIPSSPVPHKRSEGKAKTKARSLARQSGELESLGYGLVTPYNEKTAIKIKSDGKESEIARKKKINQELKAIEPMKAIPALKEQYESSKKAILLSNKPEEPWKIAFEETGHST